MSDEKKLWTYGEAKEKVRRDTDLNEDDPDEQFVGSQEMIGYFNEGIDEAESELMTMNQEYFLASDYVPLIEGVSDYPMPRNIFANKLRGIMYSNGPIIYPVKKFKMYNKFEDIEMAKQYASAADYRYFLNNPAPGQVRMTLIPASRETATLPPLANPFTPMKRWYIRNANRIPYLGEFTNPLDILPSAVDALTNDTITVAPLVPFVTGDAVKFSVEPGSDLPDPFVAGTVYYAIAVDNVTIKLATSKALAIAGTAMDITDVGSGYFTLRVAATEAIIDATVIDIPEFTTFVMEWVKANCLFKDGDPRLAGCVAKLEQQRKMMQDTLAEAEPDTDDTLSGDFSAYNELS